MPPLVNTYYVNMPKINAYTIFFCFGLSLLTHCEIIKHGVYTTKKLCNLLYFLKIVFIVVATAKQIVQILKLW